MQGEKYSKIRRGYISRIREMRLIPCSVAKALEHL